MRVLLSLLLTFAHVYHSKLLNRYVKGNKDLMKSARRYSSAIPPCLHERPHKFVLHIMKKLESARSIEKSSLLRYETTLSHCRCYSFANYSFPCKHIVSTWLTDGELQDIPTSSLSPWIEIDKKVALPDSPSSSSPSRISTKEHGARIQLAAESDSETSKSPVDNVTEDISLSSILGQIRQSLEQIKSWTYRTDSVTASQKLLDDLSRLKCEHNINITPKRKLTQLPKREKAIKRRNITKLSSGLLKRRNKAPRKYR